MSGCRRADSEAQHAERAAAQQTATEAQAQASQVGDVLSCVNCTWGSCNSSPFTPCDCLTCVRQTEVAVPAVMITTTHHTHSMLPHTQLAVDLERVSLQLAECQVRCHLLDLRACRRAKEACGREWLCQHTPHRCDATSWRYRRGKLLTHTRWHCKSSAQQLRLQTASR